MLVRLTFERDVALMTLDSPPLNVLSDPLIDAINASVADIAASSARAVIVTGSPHFAAGADIVGFKTLLEKDPEAAAGLGERLSKGLTSLSQLPVPIIAAVRGYALGGGLELAMACDLRILASGARVGQPEIKLGLIPGAGGTQRLTRLVGVGRAKEIVMSGRLVDSSEALAIGIAQRVVPDAELDTAALHWATELAAGPTVAMGVAKRVIDRGWDMPLEDALALEVEGFAETFRSRDAAEGVAAFLEKRTPDFEGR